MRRSQKRKDSPTSEAVLQNYRGMLTKKGSVFAASMLRDVESGGQAEGDHILGAMLALARKHGLAISGTGDCGDPSGSLRARAKREES